jgi:hypothetical protein
MNVRDAWSFLVRTYREELVTVVGAFASVLAGAQGPGAAIGRSAPTGVARRQPGPPARSPQTAARPAGGTNRAAPAAFDDVERALQNHPENVSLNVTPTQGAAVNATHQQRWEQAGGVGPAPPYFRVGDQYHVDHVYAPETGEVQWVLHQRLSAGRPPVASPATARLAPTSWHDVQDRLGANPYAVATSDSRTIHQKHWEEVGGSGPAPAMFRFGDDQVRVSVDDLSRAQRAELRSLLR